MTNSCIHSYAGVSLVDASGKIRPCCKFKSGWNIPTIFDVDTLNGLHNKNEYVTLQQKLNAGEWPEPCRVCNRDETVGIQSRRQFTNNMYDVHGLYQPGFLQDFEISLDYTCNMMCRMCAPGASSKWGAAYDVIKQFARHGIELDTANEYKSYQDQFYKVFSNTDLSHARHVKLEGGEPFYAKHFEWFLDKLDTEVLDKSKLFLNITTNGSVFPDQDILNKLSKFNTTIAFSIDAYGELASCIRWGVDWSIIEKNIVKWMSYSDRFNLFTNITVSILNVNMMQPLIDFCNNIGLRMSFSELTHPEYLSMYQLPLHIRQQWANGIANFDDLLLANIEIYPQYSKLLQAMEILNKYQDNNLWSVNTEIFNILRNENA